MNTVCTVFCIVISMTCMSLCIHVLLARPHFLTLENRSSQVHHVKMWEQKYPPPFVPLSVIITDKYWYNMLLSSNLILFFFNDSVGPRPSPTHLSILVCKSCTFFFLFDILRWLLYPENVILLRS